MLEAIKWTCYLMVVVFLLFVALSIPIAMISIAKILFDYAFM